MTSVFSSVTCVEINERLVTAAHQNAELNGIVDVVGVRQLEA